MKYELKQLVTEFGETYARLARDSRKRYIASLQPGQMIPKEDGKLYSEADRITFSNECEDFRARASDIIGMRRNALTKIITAAPSAEAVNTISLLNMRKNISEDELNDLMDRYGGNVQAYKTIASIASEHGYPAYGKHPYEDDLEAVNALDRTLQNTFQPTSADNGHAGPGFLSFVKLDIDNAFASED